MTKAENVGISGNSEAEQKLASSDQGGMSRRTWLGGAALMAGIGTSCMMSTSAAAKTPQKAAQYQDSPKGSSKCGSCAQFQAPNACKLVDGTISENGWCVLFTPKA